ncbi:MAG: cell envelope biogenesis protein TonB [Silanimonas sp.]|nr:MAG: cell envelope biogenesis protein TonB [Silanimonas sp.]
MSPATPAPVPEIGPAQRLTATTLLGGVLIGIVVLGVSFGRDDAAPITPTLDVILTETRSDTPPPQADFLAQASQQGGGEHEEARRPRDTVSAPVPKREDGVAPVPVRAQAPRPQAEAPMPLLSTTAEAAERAPVQPPRPETVPSPLPLGEQFLEQQVAMARLAAEVERRQAQYAKRPKRKFVSASTQEYAYAQYLRQWVERVERVGNANYPERARAERLEGRLVMTVAVRRDGSVESVTLNEPSRHETLNQAARRIVGLAAPFAAVPQAGERVDVLHITRTWEFKNGRVSSEE